MYELTCPACNSPSQFDLRDYLLMCPFCSTTFKIDNDSGQKEIFGDHYIIPNAANPAKIKGLVIEWLKRLHHKPSQVDREYFVTDVQGFSVPFWVVSMEAHAVWKGLVARRHRHRLDFQPGADFLIESGQFRRSYRWAISARSNICEIWGITRLHEAKEDIDVDWDGFPLDSTLSRGQLTETATSDRNAYDTREFFEFKYTNGVPIMGVQIPEDEALRRAKLHVEQYHLRLSRLHSDYLIDYRPEFEIAGIQLIHIPFWIAKYVYQPKTALRHFVKPVEKKVMLNGFNNGVLRGELAVKRNDKVMVNTFVCAASSVLFILLGLAWHESFFLVAAFAGIVAGISLSIALANKRAEKAREQEIPETEIDHELAVNDAAS